MLAQLTIKKKKKKFVSTLAQMNLVRSCKYGHNCLAYNSTLSWLSNMSVCNMIDMHVLQTEFESRI